MGKKLKKVTQPDNTKAVLKPQTLEKILQGHNEELQEALTTDHKRSFWGWPETEDDIRIYKYSNQPTTHKTQEAMEADRGTEESIYDNIDKDFNKSKKARYLTKGMIYRDAEIVWFDKKKNAIVSVFGWDIKWMMYNRGNIGLKVGDIKPFVYKWLNENGRYIFELPKKGRPKKIIKKTKLWLVA